jgi:nucleoside 2-deoxyribosyltransferase
MIKVYVAGPLFNSHERWYLEQMADALEQKGFITFLPHRDAGVISEFSVRERQRLFRTDIDALEKCDICVALLTGPDHDSGTSAELGYAYARGKLCFGLTDDRRWLNNLIWGLCGMGEHIYASIPELVQAIEEVKATHASNPT